MIKHRANDAIDKPVLGMLLGGLLLAVICWCIARPDGDAVMPGSAGAAIVKQLSETNRLP